VSCIFAVTYLIEIRMCFAGDSYSRPECPDVEWLNLRFFLIKVFVCRIRTEVDSAECVSSVVVSTFGVSVVACCSCGAVVRYRTMLLSSPFVSVGSQLLVRYCGLG